MRNFVKIVGIRRIRVLQETFFNKIMNLDMVSSYVCKWNVTYVSWCKNSDLSVAQNSRCETAISD